MRRTIYRAALLASLVLLLGSPVSAQDSATYTGCLKVASGQLYHVREGTSPLKPCHRRDKTISWTAGPVAVPPEWPLDLYVDAATGDDEDNCLSAGAACKTIQAAVDRIPMALGGNVTVHIADGTYSEEVVLNRRQRQGLHWISIEGNPGSPQSVVFDGLGVLDLGLFILDSLVQIKGITFSNFIDAAVPVIGVLLDVTFSDCRFTNNVGDGALYSEYSQEVVIRDCEFLNNSSAISAHNSGVVIEGNCVISNNGPKPAVNISGGSLSVNVEAGSFTITGNTGTGVRVSSQGSLGLDNGPLEVSNNGRGVECTSGSHVSFSGRADVTAMNNTGGDLIANYQSTIRGYGNGTTGGCTADTHSTCEP